jgi:2-polyprenyl-6-methoxyphenol hydroxylase-like FAD-dependent oxidoreductase
VVAKLLGDRVVVLGAGMGGLVTTQVLSEYFDEVVLVDRDRLTEVREARRGVPQGRHAHGLVARGHQLLEGLFPRLTEQMTRAGIEPGDLNGDIRWYFGGVRLRPVRTGLLSIPATRPVLEYHVRSRVLDLPNLKLLEDTDIAGLTTTADHRRVTGVRLRRDGGVMEGLDADLVVDTSGRGSRTPVWLAELGYGKPAEDQVKIGLAYTTQHFRLDRDPLGKDIAIIPAATPTHPRGAFFYRLPGTEGGFELSLTGMLGDHPPADPEGFLEFTRTLPVKKIYEAVKDAEPLDDPVMLRYPASTRRRYDKLDRFPERFLVMADAVCSFNPLYAQGMTVAALEATTLRKHLERGIPSALPFFRDISAVIEQPWQFSAIADLAYPGVEGKRTLRTRVVNAYLPKLQAAAAHDPKLSAAFIRAAGLIDPPQALLRPDILARALRPRPARV